MKYLILLISFILCTDVSSNQNELVDLNLKLQNIRSSINHDPDNLDSAEKEYLDLLNNSDSVEEKSQIYYNIVETYSGFRGFKDKKIFYGEEALKYDLNNDQKSGVYMILSYAYKCKSYSNVQKYYLDLSDTCVVDRRTSMSLALEAYKHLMMYNLPDSMLVIDGFPMNSSLIFIDSKEDSIRHQKSIEKRESDYKLYLTKRDSIDFINSLLRRKDLILKHVIDLYTYRPYENDEFYQMIISFVGEAKALDLLDTLDNEISKIQEEYKIKDDWLDKHNKREKFIQSLRENDY